MSRKIKDLIYTTTGIDLDPDTLSSDVNAQMAIASLLAVAAHSDGSIDSEETAKMVEVLCRHYALPTVIAMDTVMRALDQLAGRKASPELLDELNDRLTMKQKEDLVLMLLEVIAADGKKQGHEMAVLDQTVAALNISVKQLDDIYGRYFEGRRKGDSNQAQ